MDFGTREMRVLKNPAICSHISAVFKALVRHWMYASMNTLKDQPVICIMLCSNLFDASYDEIRVSLLLFFFVYLRRVDHVTSCLHK